jgi:hypothetical protein
VSLLRWILSPNQREQRAERERVKHESRAFGMLVVAGLLIGTPILIALSMTLPIDPRLAFAIAIAVSLALPMIAGKLGRLLVPSWLERPSWAVTIATLILIAFYALIFAIAKWLEHSGA